MGAKTRIPYGKRFAMFKRFLMDNSHREHIKNLFRWWNGHVFSFEAPGTIGTENRGEDSGMEEALKALDSDEEFGGDSWYGQDGPDPHHPDNLSIDFVNFTISEHTSVPVAAPANAIAAPQVREPTPANAIIAPRVRESTPANAIAPRVREPMPANAVAVPQVNAANTITPRVREPTPMNAIAPQVREPNPPNVIALRIREPTPMNANAAPRVREPNPANTIAPRIREPTPVNAIAAPRVREPNPPNIIAPWIREPTPENAIAAPRVREPNPTPTGVLSIMRTFISDSFY